MHCSKVRIVLCMNGPESMTGALGRESRSTCRPNTLGQNTLLGLTPWGEEGWEGLEDSGGAWSGKRG